ncbi:MAG: glycoside hydrolase family 2 protein, partial [Bacteroidota bacterium]
MRQVVDLCNDDVPAGGESPAAEWWVTHCRPGRGETIGLPAWTVQRVQERRWTGFADAAGAEDAAGGSGSWQETREKWIAARVPGDVHLDLLRAGIIPEPMEGRNFAALEWVEQEEWWYLCSYNLTQAQVDAARATGAELVFEGLDTEARIWLNGCPVGRTNNMFRTFRLAVSDELKPGENTLVVRVGVGLAHVQDKPLRRLARSWNQDDLRRLWLRKAQFGFGWDWSPRLVSCGIWRPVRLELPGAIVLRNVRVHETLPPEPLPADRPAPATVYVEAEVDCALPKFTDVVVTASWTPLTRPTERGYTDVFHRRLFPGRNRVTIRMELPEVWPWWPRPLGTPFLYELKLSVSVPADAGEGRDGNEPATAMLLDELRLRHGFRRVDLRQTPRPMVTPDTDAEIKGLPPGEATTFTFFVNGVPVFAQGGNWVPADCLPARVTAEKHRFLLERAVDAGCNMLRVWGGGIYEHPLFYDLCDEFGIMVWQEFMFACGYYPDFDAEFRAEVEAEAEDVVRRLRHHPCIVVWAGNNEIATMAWGHWRWGGQIDPEVTVALGLQGSSGMSSLSGSSHSPGSSVADVRQYPGQRLFEEILAGVCARFDPSRPYLPSSPMSQPGVEPDYPWQGDTHTWYPGVDYEKDYGRDASGFCSEFGCVGPADAATLCQAVPALR